MIATAAKELRRYDPDYSTAEDAAERLLLKALKGGVDFVNMDLGGLRHS
jgi:hypothetical protein